MEEYFEFVKEGLEIYPTDIALFATNSPVKTAKFFEKEDVSPFYAETCPFCYKNRKTLFVGFNFEYGKDIKFSILVHEIVHVKNFIFMQIGYNPSPENDECEAYLTDYLVERYLKMYKKLKNKLKKKGIKIKIK